MYFDPAWRQRMTAVFDSLLHDLHEGSVWEPYLTTAWRLLRGLGLSGRGKENDRAIATGGEAVPLLKDRMVGGVPCARPKPAHYVSVGNQGPCPKDACGGCATPVG